MSTRVYEEIEELQFPSPHSHYQLLNTEPHTYAELRNFSLVSRNIMEK